jgi:NAD(P)-dependent dehydrogenase (short-subunit alcohol dehydrogenase family)
MCNHQMRSLNNTAARSSCTVDARQDNDVQTGLKNKVTLIFSDASESVRSLALALAQKGSDVIILACQTNPSITDELEAQIEACEQRILIIEKTGIDRLVAQEIIEQILECFGRLDVYIDYSGHPFSVDSLLRRQKKELSAHPSLSLMKAALPHMIKAARLDVQNE